MIRGHLALTLSAGLALLPVGPGGCVDAGTCVMVQVDWDDQAVPEEIDALHFELRDDEGLFVERSFPLPPDAPPASLELCPGPRTRSPLTLLVYALRGDRTVARAAPVAVRFAGEGTQVEVLLEAALDPVAQLQLSGPEAVPIDGCAGRYAVELLDDTGQPAPVAEATVIQLAAVPEVSFHHDRDCRGEEIDAVSVAAGQSAASFALVASVAGTTKLTATYAPAIEASLSLVAGEPTWHTVEAFSPPTPRNAAAGVYAPDLDRFLLYGGFDGANGDPALAELWQLDDTAWSRVCADCPPGPRSSARLMWDGVRQRALLYGGAELPFTEDAASAELWSWDGTTWTLQERSPVALRQPAVAYDAARGAVVVFGGMDSEEVRFDGVYEHDGVEWRGPLQPTPRPAPRVAATAAFDPEAGAVVIYGGYGGEGGLDDLWSWDGTAWTQLCDSCSGTGRTQATLYWYPPRRELHVTGGFVLGDDEVDGTWRFDGAALVEVSSEPPARDSMAVGWDPARLRVVGFGGNGSSCAGESTHGHCGQTWVFAPGPR